MATLFQERVKDLAEAIGIDVGELKRRLIQTELDIIDMQSNSFELENDLSPELGGHLLLNGFQIQGTLENSSFVLDGGLL